MTRKTTGLSARIRAALSTTRGRSVREIHVAVGEPTPLSRGRVATELTVLARAGKARHNNRPSRGGRLWYATADTHRDFRAAAAPKDKPKPAPKPRHKQQELRVAARPKPAPVGRGKCQSVAEWLAQGGKIEILPRHATSRPFERIQIDATAPARKRSGRVMPKRMGAP